MNETWCQKWDSNPRPHTWAYLEVQCDASNIGLGATLMQENQPIVYSSRTLTETEKHYAPIEKELLAVVWSMEKFHQYTYGNYTTVYSDHKPLEFILKKALKDVPKRLQNMRIRLQNYNMTVQYRPGVMQHVADFLSRSPTKSEEHVASIVVDDISHILIGESWRTKLVAHTSQDSTLVALKQQIATGWPESSHTLPDLIKTYHSFHEELAFTEGIIYRGERVVVPTSLRPEMIQEVHSSHMGVQACLRRARECLYWPGMNAEIKQYVAQCDTCQQYSVSQSREPLLPLEIPERPWEVVSCDLFHLKANNYLITVDHLSNFFEVDKLDDMTAKMVIRKLRVHFSRYGQPEVLISDNGPQFVSSEFEQFASSWNFTHRTSSPNHQQANGRAEAAVKICKRLLMKAADDDRDPYMALLAYRNTIQEGLLTSPAQRFLGRRTRTNLPTTSALLAPCTNTDHSKLKQRQDKSRTQYNAHAKPLSVLESGNSVRVKPTAMHSKVWVKGSVLQRLDDRSYLLDAGKSVIRRNRVDLRHVPATTSASAAPGVCEPSATSSDCVQPNVCEPPATSSDCVNSDVCAPDKTPIKDVALPVELSAPESTTSHKNLRPSVESRPRRQRRLPRHLNDYVVKLK